MILKQDNAWRKFTGPRRVIVTEKLEQIRHSLEEVERLVNENGWTAAGFVSYEAAPAFDSALKVIASKNGFPLLWFGLYDSSKPLESLETLSPLPPLEWTPDTERETYNHAIQTIKDRIAQGKTYQVNYTMRLSTNLGADLTSWQLFTHLAHSQNKYAAYLDIGNWSICSASHELFFDLDDDVITSRPMKGTIKRGRTTAEDTNSQNWLRASIKNQAENVMIVDMIRNDIGRIATLGSVHVPELFTIEKYPTLFQMTSTVKAKTKASVTEIFTNLFPCASITGAPKVSTMNIIADIETSPRKVYCGSIGYIEPNRKARFNVAIRTAVVDKQNHQAEYGIGGGIVWDSTSADEYGEALLKARVLTDPPQKDFSLFETLLWTPEEGYFLLERHIARILDSAVYFGFESTHAEKKLRQVLAESVIHARSSKRVKVILSPNGEVTAEIKDFQPSDKVFQVCLAKEPINSNDRFLFHKTTNRTIYEKAAIQGFDDVLLYNEKEELTEFTIGSFVARINGEFFTPPIECGLLAGTFRAELVASGEVKERVIKIQDRAEFEAVFLVNSLRKWVQIKMK
ncbi:MAG: aminodeoxychorismate synthase component I [Anaerolineales bacterium]